MASSPRSEAELERGLGGEVGEVQKRVAKRARLLY